MTYSLLQYMTTGAINRTHSKKTKALCSPKTTQMYHFFISGKFGQKTPTMMGLPDRVPLHPDNCHVIRPYLRLSTPAAQAAEWVHYMSDVLDESQ